jgi:SRSO17 transposase
MENHDRMPDSLEARFDAYLDRLSQAVGHADRAAPLRGYCTGLLLPGERKSVEPMAARIAPRRVSATHQSLHHFVATSEWSDAALLAAVRDYALPAMTSQEPIRAWIIDDTGLPKQGKHSVGVARQYCGQLGKTDNCQVAVTLSLANHAASLPVAYRLYLPDDWAADPERRQKAGVPESVTFQTKPAIALSQIAAALSAGIPQGVVLADAGYGNETAFRDQLSAWELLYAVGIQPSTAVYRPGTGPLPPATHGGRGRKASRWRRAPAAPPVSVKQRALELPPDAWQTVTWREGSHGELASRFAAVRVRAAHDDRPRAEEWLLIEWPEGEAEPTRYWLSTLPADTALTELVDTAKLRWRIERDYRELKQELGLGHFEGRGWRGFHHHASLCIAAYGFLVAERGAFPPSGVRTGALFEAPALPADYRPRGAAAAGAAASS